jgi:hypothetical protein
MMAESNTAPVGAKGAPTDATSSRQNAIRATERLLEAAKELHSSLRVGEAVYQKGLDGLRGDLSIAMTMDAVQAGVARVQLSECLEEFERCRHEVRLSLIAAGRDEGMSLGELGKAWGFSRQMASRYAEEARNRA